MKTIAKSAFRRRVRFAAAAAVLAAIGGALAAEAVYAQVGGPCFWQTHNNKIVCFYIKGYASDWTTYDNQVAYSLHNAATGGSHEQLIYKEYWNDANHRDRWHCNTLASFTTKPPVSCTSANTEVLNSTGKLVVNASDESPKYFNLHQSKKRICIMVHRNSNGSAWNKSPNSSDVWDLEQQNTDGNCRTP